MERKKLILVVDDDPEMRLALMIRLKANNYDVIFADDGVNSIKAAREHHPELVLLDLGLPVGDGFTVLERMQENKSLRLIPTIVITGRDRIANKDRAMMAGAKAFLQKPIDNTQMMMTIANCLCAEQHTRVYNLDN